MPFAAYPVPPHDPAVGRVAEVLDPILVPLGFAPGQTGASGDRGQVIFCRGDAASRGGCVDMVIDLGAAPDWRIIDVRYWGFSSDRWHLAVPGDEHLEAQLTTLARTLADDLR